MRHLLIFLGIAGALLIPGEAYANALYFEFNPDFGEGLFVASSRQPVEQIFLPLNDHLSAFDVWVSNKNIAGDVTFELYDQSNILLSSVTRFVSATPDSPSGTRIGIVLPAQVSTIANEPYVIRFTTAVPEFRLYYATQNAILSHNAEPQAVYTGGLARIGGDERGFAFKSALYESAETKAPVITNVNASVVSVNEVRITFNAGEPVDARVVYGPQGQSPDSTVPFTGQYTGCAEGIQLCSVTLPILHQSTGHDFTMTARDVWGNASDITGAFTSLGVSLAPTPAPSPSGAPTPLPTPDTTAPVIANARAVNVTHKSAGIAWTTNEAANSLVVVQFGVDNITVGGGSDSTLELEHLISIADLAQQTTYKATVRSGDAWGNETVSTFQFATAPAPTSDPGTPVPSQSPTPVPTIILGPSGGGGLEVQWPQPEGGAPTDGYRVDIIGADGHLIRSLTTDDTSVALGDVPDGARIIVYANRGNGVFEKIAAPLEIKKGATLAQTLLLNLPAILIILGAASVGGALLWRKMLKPKLPAGISDIPPADAPSERHDFTSSV